MVFQRCQVRDFLETLWKIINIQAGKGTLFARM